MDKKPNLDRLTATAEDTSKGKQNGTGKKAVKTLVKNIKGGK